MMLRSAPERVLVACFALVFCFTGFSFRLVQLQVTKHDEYAALAAKAHGTKRTIPARRGSILDSRGTPLAQNEPVKTVIVDASTAAVDKAFQDYEGIAKVLAD